jgi:tetratricopeptide (TPR) repeat protein
MADLDGLKRPADFQVNPGAAKHFFKLLPADRVIAEARDDIRLGRNVEDAYFRLAVAFERKGAWADAVAAYTAAGRLYPNNGDMIGRLALLLATCPDARIQDSDRALALAETARVLRPLDPRVWRARGVATYRAGNWPTSLESLNRSIELNQGGEGEELFFLAMVHSRLGNAAIARDWYEQAVRWLAKSKPVDETSPRARELARFRAEAETLLGIQK